MRRSSRVGQDDQGAALVATMLVAAVLTLLATVLVSSSLADLNRSSQEVQRSASFQAAEAGIEDYLAKLTEDRRYLTKYVHPAESTRQKASGVEVPAASTPTDRRWDSSTTWTYPLGRNTWRSLDNGYEYNLQVTAPTGGSVVIKLTAVGRKTGSTRWARSIEVTVRAGSLAEYQMVSNSDVRYGPEATTNGKVYAGNGADVDHDGVANAPIYAEGQVTGSFSTKTPVAWYDIDRPSPFNIRDGVNSPLLFANFATARTEVNMASTQPGGLKLPALGVGFDVWKLVFVNNGTVLTSKCRSLNLQTIAPNFCQAATSRAMPTNGALEVTESVAVSGVVDGRVTLATNQSIYIQGNISYETDGDDVLGLVARVDVIVPTYAPYDLDWRAVALAETGRRHSADGVSGTHGRARFYGSTVTFGSPFMDMFDVREYYYDDTLIYLPPPYWRVLDDEYEVLSFRELTA